MPPSLNSAAQVRMCERTAALVAAKVEWFARPMVCMADDTRMIDPPLADELAHPEVTTILDDFVKGVRDVSLVWPKRRFVPTRVRRVTDFFAHAMPQRL